MTHTYGNSFLRQVRKIIIIVLSGIILASCSSGFSFQKRRYNCGVYVSNPGKVQQPGLNKACKTLVRPQETEVLATNPQELTQESFTAPNTPSKPFATTKSFSKSAHMAEPRLLSKDKQQSTILDNKRVSQTKTQNDNVYHAGILLKKALFGLIKFLLLVFLLFIIFVMFFIFFTLLAI